MGGYGFTVVNGKIHYTLLCFVMFVTTGQACIVMEYMDGGDLHGFLKNIKGSQQLSYSHAMSLKEVEKLDIASQIALGLEFLASKKVLETVFKRKIRKTSLEFSMTLLVTNIFLCLKKIVIHRL